MARNVCLLFYLSTLTDFKVGHDPSNNFEIISTALFNCARHCRLEHIITIMSSSSLKQYQNFDTLLVTNPNENVYHVQLNRPKQLNSMNQAFWRFFFQYYIIST